MSRYFQGFVSRFNAGPRTAEVNGAQAAFAVSQLTRLGISPAGTVQLVTGKVVTSAEDRQVLAKALVALARD